MFKRLWNAIKRRCCFLFCCCKREPNYGPVQTVIASNAPANTRWPYGKAKVTTTTSVLEDPLPRDVVESTSTPSAYGTIHIELWSRDEKRRSDTLSRHQIEALLMTTNGHLTLVGPRNTGIHHNIDTGVISFDAVGSMSTIEKWMDISTWSMLALKMNNHYDIISASPLIKDAFDDVEEEGEEADL